MSSCSGSCDPTICEPCYERIETEGIFLDSVVCPGCPDPGLCMAEGECGAGGTPLDL